MPDLSVCDLAASLHPRPARLERDVKIMIFDLRLENDDRVEEKAASH